MIYTITNSLTAIDFAPAETAEILQNCRTIISTVKGSAPLHRNFGIDSSQLDAPINEITKTKIVAEIVAQIQQYESRCRVKKVEISADGINGGLFICAYIDVPA